MNGQTARTLRDRAALLLKRKMQRLNFMADMANARHVGVHGPDTDHAPHVDVPTEEEMMAPDLASLTRDELRKMAAERNIPGRGKMTKDDLVEALRDW